MKFAFLGPESTGKTTTAKLIAERLKAIYIPEVAREFLAEKKLDYTQDDILEIAKGQYILELEACDTHPDTLILCDTELITIEIWLEYYQYEVPSWISNAIEQSSYTQYLLFDIDIAWQIDPLRNNPNDRKEILERFIRKLNYYRKPWQWVRGQDDERVNCALEIIQSMY